MLLILIVVLSISSVLLQFVLINNNYWRKRNVVQANGITWKFLFGKISIAELYKQIYDEHPNVDHIGIFIGSKPTLLLKNLENIQAVLLSDFQSFNSRGVVINSNDLLADNIVFIEDYQRWKILRSKLSPIFTSKKLKNMFFIMEKCARDFVELVESNPSKENSFNSLYTYTTAAIGASVFGLDTLTENTMNSPFQEMARKALKPTLAANAKSTLSNTFPKLFNLLKLKIFGDHEDFFIGVVKKVLKHRRSQQNNETKHDFVDLCVELQKNGIMQDPVTGYKLEPSDELMAAQAFFFFIAGADTSAYTMLFTLLELAGHPDILNKLHKEIDLAFDSCKENVTYDVIEKMQYLEMVLSETLRKYPPVGTIQRKCTKNTKLPIGGMIVEKGTLAVTPVYALHRDERYFPNPDTFDPERFATENISKIPKCSYLPFGEGNRSCIGARFTRLQVKIGLAWLLRRFTLKQQTYNPKHFEPSGFAIRDSNARFELIPRVQSLKSHRDCHDLIC